MVVKKHPRQEEGEEERSLREKKKVKVKEARFSKVKGEL